jgi:hypothetical protein
MHRIFLACLLSILPNRLWIKRLMSMFFIRKAKYMLKK